MFNRPPWLMFIEPEPTGTSTPPAPPAPQTDEQFLTEFGFPRNTAEADMTPEQGRAYWRNMAKTKQKEADAYKGIGTPEQARQAIADAEKARQAALTADDRAKEEARIAGLTEGTNAARDKYLAPAIQGQLVALTKGASESIPDAQKRVSGALEFADLSRFLDSDGALDAEKVQTFATSIGSTDSNGNGQKNDPLFDSLQRQGHLPPASPGSVAAKQEETYKRLSKKQQ